MAPRFPKPAKKKPSQAPVINFSSAEAALGSIELDFDGWMAEGVHQEEQGERYQFGAKAQRHYTNAALCYSLALRLSPKSFDGLYNLSRVKLHLATDHLSPPACLRAGWDAIAGFRTALELAGTQEEETVDRAIDAGFNLAQALMAARGLVEEGAGKGEEDEWQIVREAREALERVEALQTQALAREGFTGSSNVGMEQIEEEEDDGAAGETTGAGASTAAKTTTLVTPNQTLDTILQLNETLLALYTNSPTPELAQAVVSSLDRAVAVRQLLPPGQNNAEQDQEFELAALACADALHSAGLSTRDTPYALSPAQVSERYAGMIARSPRDVELVSSYADHLADSLVVSCPPAELLTTIELALRTYERAHALLTDPFSSKKSIPAHIKPALVSANLHSRAHLLLLLHQFQPTLILPSGQTPLSASHQLSLQALTSSAVGIKLSPAGSPVRSPAAECRSDWRTLKAARDAVILLTRVEMRRDGRGSKAWFEVWRRISERDVRGEVEWAREEVGGDVVWEASAGEEELAWRGLVEEITLS